ncbi:aspartate aminotransferase family protein [Streptomyces albospinus]|uniref:Aspartate aminotransferase family protein n=1 Tax=Streptomyces albospinus TaxID=285515 RepID=A0ABQ2VQR3_9ACTN|nr:aminotransferase class III-fold pyridoxal phosphate-dependent enzyme [Streptomyces albospinus]GGV02269.1 aspartate aminotransferase family protein [Streptomyces albospinus]
MSNDILDTPELNLRAGKPVAVKASGCWVYDTEGRDYLDGSSGTICVNIGHGVPEIISAMTEQAQQLGFAHRNQFASQAVRELTAEIHRVTGHRFKEVVYTNSGSEATETALRLVLNHHAARGDVDRTVVLAQFPSYHGMTAGALSISGHPQRRRNLDPLHDNRLSLGTVAARDAASSLPTLAEWEERFAAIGPERIAAVVVEPVSGAAGGAAELPDETLRGLRELCDRSGTLLVIDEVMTGFGRTGEWFGHDRSGVRPDLVITAKGLSAGYTPIGACLVSREVLPGQSATDAAVGHTMSGNPVSAATALAVLRYMQEHDLVAHAAKLGPLLTERLAEVTAGLEFTRPPRGRGLLQGVPLVQDAEEFATNPLAPRICAAAMEYGLQLYPAGVDARSQTILVAPPLTITEAELDILIARLEQALRLVAATTHAR